MYLSSQKGQGSPFASAAIVEHLPIIEGLSDEKA
jgi:hypothetical protein